jgi:hypothetical protein
MKPKAYMTNDEKMLIFADVTELDGIIPLYDGRDIDKIIKAIKKCFPHTMACDGVLIVNMDSYNELVELINEN